MGLFKSKEEKAQERKALVRRSMRELEKRIQKLDAQRGEYVKMAQIAIREELPQQLQLAKTALKMTISERQRTYKMLLNAKIIAQMKDTNAMTADFLQAMRVISKDIVGGSSADMAKLTNELRTAMGKVTMQTEQLEDMMSEVDDDMDDVSIENSTVADDEIDKLIYGTVSGETDGGTAAAGADMSSIDADLDAMKKLL